AIVENAVKQCNVCVTCWAAKRAPAMKPITAEKFLAHVQVKPAKTKFSIETAYFLLQFCLKYGTPPDLYSDNGGESVGNIVKETIELWPSVKFIHGRPRYPQCQGSVEKGNDIYKQNLDHGWMKLNEMTGALGCHL
ncbi:20037_t:CDS:2, partial [Gigaspora rosea]